MKVLVNPIDQLTIALRLFQAADLAVAGLSLDHERRAMCALMFEALEKMEAGLNALNDLHKGAEA